MPQDLPEISLAVSGETFLTLFTKLTQYFESLESTLSGPSAPAAPVDGMMWFNTTTREMNIFANGTWYPLLSALGVLPMGSILGRYFADNTIDANAKVRVGTITAALLANNSITEEKLQDNIVGTQHIQDGAVTRDKVGRVGTANYANETIEGQHIRAGALDGGLHLRDGSVPLSKLQNFQTLRNLS